MRRIVPYVRAPVRYLIYLRFARYLLYEFRWPLIVFTLLVISKIHPHTSASTSTRPHFIHTNEHLETAATKLASFEPVAIHAATGAGAPSYASGAH